MPLVFRPQCLRSPQDREYPNARQPGDPASVDTPRPQPKSQTVKMKSMVGSAGTREFPPAFGPESLECRNRGPRSSARQCGIRITPRMASRRKCSKAALTLPVQNCLGHDRARRIAGAKDQNVVDLIGARDLALGGERIGTPATQQARKRRRSRRSSPHSGKRDPSLRPFPHRDKDNRAAVAAGTHQSGLLEDRQMRRERVVRQRDQTALYRQL